jgi:hypothetical protein
MTRRCRQAYTVEGDDRRRCERASGVAIELAAEFTS